MNELPRQISRDRWLEAVKNAKPCETCKKNIGIKGEGWNDRTECPECREKRGRCLVCKQNNNDCCC